jgi:hypothetical protein
MTEEFTTAAKIAIWTPLGMTGLKQAAGKPGKHFKINH